MIRFDMPSTPRRQARRIASPAARFGLGALCLLPLAAFAGQSNGPELLRMKFKQGDTNKYQMNIQVTVRMTMNMPAGQPHSGAAAQPMTIPMNINVLNQQQVTRVLPNGNGIITSTVLNQQTSLNGHAQPAPNTSSPTTITMSPLGKVISVTGMPQQNPMSGVFGPNSLSGMGIFLPSRPVHPGDSWTETMRLPGVTGAGTGTAQSHFIRYETVGRYRAALIRTVSTVPLNMNMNMMGQPVGRSGAGALTMSGSLRMTTDTDFAVAEGKVIRTTGNGIASTVMRFPHTNRPAQPGMGTMPQSTQMNMKMTMSQTLMQ